MAHQLTSGAVAVISEGGGDGMQPVLQISDVRQVSTPQNTTERYRMLLSDGAHTQQAMLATQLNSLVKEGNLQAGSIVQLHEYVCNQIQGRRIIIVIQVEILQSKCEIIGTPRMYEIGTSPSLANNPNTGNSAKTHSTGQTPQTGPSINPRQQPPSNNPSYNANTGVRNMLNQPNFQMPKPSSPNLNASTHSNNSLYNASMNVRNMMNQPTLQTMKPENPNLNQSFQFRPPASTISSSNTYSRPAQQPPFQQPPPPLYVNRGPIAKNEAPAVIFPISRLNPFQGRWTIKARVSLKGELRSYNNTKGDGKVFSFDLIDSEGGQIRVTCFNNVAEHFYPKIEFGKVYLISKGSIKQANKRFNPLNHEYEMNLESGSMVEPCEDDNTIPGVTFCFRQISDIESLPSDTILDVIGVVTSISPASIVMKKNGSETSKRTLQLKDMSGRSVELSLWGNFVSSEGKELQSMCDSGQFPILAIKGGRVNDFNGKSVSSIPGSQLFVEPDCVEAQQLRDWYNREGKSASAVSISFQTGMQAGRADNRKTCSQIKEEGLGHEEKPDWISIKGTITFFVITNGFSYTACPLMINDRQCNKKVTNNGDGTWRCDRCDQNFPDCDYRYLLTFDIQDHTGVARVTAFQEAGEQIMGRPAKDLHRIKYEEEDDEKFSEIIRSVLFKQFIFKLKVKEESYGEVQQVKVTVVSAEKVDPSTESKYLLGQIDKMLLEDQRPNQNLYPNTAPGNGNDRPNLYVGARNQQMPLCSGCGSSGHNVLNCPTSMNRQVGGAGGGFANSSLNNMGAGGLGGADSGLGNDRNVCFKCQQPGHWARDCPNVAPGSGGGAGYGAGNVQNRYNNNQYGGNY
ncbi:hypothetical protein LUZ61_017414 [Rhynchospora tenuis]|uniref:Replication protein A subunit n=1 Tax=Rhynchospora tenuis TaxID=198213 RepID=A0AAD5Z7F6_9POAL|nr:hypothetical protein LUZ61_017414 [Rhynchospora tenuis]